MATDARLLLNAKDTANIVWHASLHARVVGYQHDLHSSGWIHNRVDRLPGAARRTRDSHALSAAGPGPALKFPVVSFFPVVRDSSKAY